MSLIAICITRALGADTVQFNTDAPTPAEAMAIVGQLTGASEISQATDKVIADAKKPAAAASSQSGAKPETTEKKAAAPAAEAKKPAAESESKSAAGPDSSKPIDYDQVKVKVLALAQEKGRDVLVALLQRHGAAKAPELKPMQYADFLNDIDGINEGTYDPVTGEDKRHAVEAELA